MNLAIDPNVFVATVNQDKCGYHCSNALVRLEQERDKHKIIINQELKNAYTKFVDTNSRNKGAHNYLLRQSLAYAQRLIKTDTALKLLSIEAMQKLPDPVADIMQKGDCDDTDVHMVKLANAMENAKTVHDLGASLVLLMACCLLPPTTKLFDEVIRTMIKKHLPSVMIECASNPKFTHHHIDPSKLTNTKQHSLHFEELCNKWIHRYYKAIIEGPCRINNEEVDVLCYEETDNLIHTVYVGECKLRVENETATLYKSQFAKQLQCKIKAIEEYDWRQKGLQGKPQVKGLLFGDHDKLEVDAWKFLKKFDCTFVQVRMPSQWRVRADWTLALNDFTIIEYPEDLDEFSQKP